MGKDGIKPLEACIFICTECFGKLASFMLTNPNWIKQQGIPSALKAIPLEKGIVEPCEYCNFAQATGYIPTSLPKKENGEREIEN